MKQLKQYDEIPIAVENFELLVKKYRPLLLNQIKQIFAQCNGDIRLEFDDLWQEAQIALYRAIEQYDPARKVYFGVYIKTALANNLKCYVREYLPSYYAKTEGQYANGQPKFKSVFVPVGSLEDEKGLN